MKKTILASMAVPALIFASCSNESMPEANFNDGPVVFTAQLPGNFTRSFADGNTAVKLTYAVYEADDNMPIIKSGDPGAPAPVFAGREAKLALNLVKGKSYDIVFWADAFGIESTLSPYTFNPTDQTITINYDGINGNDETRDAFFQVEKNVKVSGGLQKTVELRRPFAQLNFGTNDLSMAASAMKSEPASAELEVSNSYNTLNLISGVASNTKDFNGKVKFAKTAFPCNNETPEVFPVDGYDYLSMNYVLTGSVIDETTVQKAEKEIVDCNFKVFDLEDAPINTISLSNMPVQRNYRTNVYGALLTSQVNYTVVIEPDFNEPANVVEYSSEWFMEKVENGEDIEIPANKSVDLTSLGKVELKNNQVLTVDGVLNTARAQISISGEGNVAVVTGTGLITSNNLDGVGNRPLNVYDGATLKVSGVTIETEQKTGGSSIFSENGNIELDDVKVNCHFFAIGANGGSFTAKNSVFKSDSNTGFGPWAYTISVNSGCKATLDNCTMIGYQGGVSVGNEGSELTINSGTYKTDDFGLASGPAHYPVYIYDMGVAIINGGDFISFDKATVFNGNNDVPEKYTWGNGAVIKGGRFNSKTYNQKDGKELPAAPGYKWVELAEDQAPFKYEVVVDPDYVP